MEYIVHGSKNQIDSSFFTYFGAISLNRNVAFVSKKSLQSKVSEKIY